MINLKLQTQPWAAGARVDPSYQLKFKVALHNLDIFQKERGQKRRTPGERGSLYQFTNHRISKISNIMGCHAGLVPASHSEHTEVDPGTKAGMIVHF